MENPLGQRLRELPGPLLLTGHTGFKGTWMTFLLEHLNVPVVGYSLPAERDSLFDRAERTGVIPEAFADIRDYETLESFIDLHKPSTIIHMAAQPLVLKSYESPRETFDVNVMGTVNVLDVAFKKKFVQAVIVVTTDKVYKNNQKARPFLETDPLEGKDPYSASKVGTEAVVAAWQQIAKVSGGPKILSVRAGNVIGGGDFASARLLPDVIRSIYFDKPIDIRNPESTRPWQYVLDPLRGYLLAMEHTLDFSGLRSLNFGPNEHAITVGEVLNIAQKQLQYGQAQLKYELGSIAKSGEVRLESTYLDLDSNEALKLLNWRPVYSQTESIERTLSWWRQVIIEKSSARDVTKTEINRWSSSLKL
jgi:CDP-glucose 4,6-dehydratase